MQAKLNPYNDAKISFPGFQRILDFTATGAESSKSVTVDGDTDKEYQISVMLPTASSSNIVLRLNADTGSNYGMQRILNSSGTIVAERVAGGASWNFAGLFFWNTQCSLLTPAGFIKTSRCQYVDYTSGTTLGGNGIYTFVWNSTANVTSLDFYPSGATFVANSRITVYARRSE